MHRRIFAIAVPAIVANIVVPLLGLLDLAIAGHIGATAMIGAVAVGATMFNLTYWNFGFLRMGTSGMTAQAFGRNDRMDCASLFVRSSIVATAIGMAIVVLQVPLRELLLWAIEPSSNVRVLVVRYFGICVWGAPALLATMSISGWFVGMQNSVYQMIVSISVNVTNIIASLLLVFVFDAGFVGIAVGTLIAQWVGALLAFALAVRLARRHGLPQFRVSRDSFAGMGRFFKINTHIFLRSLCMMAVMLFFTSAGARSGDTVLAVNALIMQLFVVYSYFMDGIAYAVTEGETLVDGTGYDISFGPSVIPVTITGTGSSSYCYAIINGTTYTSATSGIEVSAGDVITFKVYSAQKSTPGKVIINGDVVASVTGTVAGNGITHEWTVPEGCASISIQLYIAKGSLSRVLYTTATVTTT